MSPSQAGAVVLIASRELGDNVHLVLDDLPTSDMRLADMLWTQVRLKAEHLGDHPSYDEMVSLIERCGVPDWMGSYVADRMRVKEGHRRRASWLAKREKLHRAYLLALEVAERHEKGGTRELAMKEIASQHNMAVSTLKRTIGEGRSQWKNRVSDPRESWPSKRNLAYIRAGGESPAKSPREVLAK